MSEVDYFCHQAPSRGRDVAGIAPLGVGIGWEIGADGLEWTALFPQIAHRVRYVETAPIYDPRSLDRIRGDLGSDFRFVLHYSGLSLPGPTTLIEQHSPIVEGMCATLGSPWFVEDLGYWSIEGTDLGSFCPVILSEEALDTCIRNLTALQRCAGYPYLAENPPFSTVLGDIHIVDFMSRLSRATGAPYLIDVGHLYSYLSLTGEEPLECLERVEWDRVLEMHVAGGEMVRRAKRGSWIYDDNHSKPILPEVFDLLALMLPRARNLKALTIEVDFNQAGVGVANPLEVAVSNFFKTYEVAERWVPHLTQRNPRIRDQDQR